MQKIATLGFVVWNVLMIGWTATFIGGVGNCVHEAGWSLAVCEAGRTIGIEIGFPFILAVWIVGAAALAMVWLRGRTA